MVLRGKKVFCPKVRNGRSGKYIDAKECYQCLFCFDTQTDAVDCKFSRTGQT